MIDLKELLDDRSAPPDGLSQHLRLDEVQGRIATRRRRRMTVGGALATVVALILIGYGVTPALRSAPEPAVTPSPLPRLIEGFPEYASGARVVAAATSAPGATSVTITFTPTTTDLRIFDRCGPATTDGALEYKLTINGHDYGGGTCNGSSSPYWPDHPDAAAKLGIEVGRPATITMTAKAMVVWGDGAGRKTESRPVPPTAWLSVAVGEHLPFADYPLPPRPATLSPVDFTDRLSMGGVQHAPDEEHLWLRSDPADPLRPMSVTIVWQDRYDLRLRAQTPGTLSIALNGVEVESRSWWDYKANDINTYWQTGTFRPYSWVTGFTTPAPGSLVTLTVTPRDVTGAWIVRVIPGKETA
ncbi:hypothetical protein [Catellatospora sichuanensis]|uniref:hypothetical protein n=1 Tax=Catellatospora sichuanensis TaxID=1969805 RepID=UPI00118420F4|nr:hypothetical protein [Catellatospora sichuanensis]